MMSQTLLPFKYEIEQTKSGLTSFAGLPLWLELVVAVDLFKVVARHLKIRTSGQGFADGQILASLILLQIAGGDSVDDLDQLRKDEGFAKTVTRMVFSMLGRKERRKQERKKRHMNQYGIPSASVVRRWLENFHDAGEEKSRPETGAWIPKSNRFLRVMGKINDAIVGFLQKHHPCRVATLDMDATLIETFKESAKFCYKGFRAYQPLNVWWAEQEAMVHTEFRDGNVPAGQHQKRLLEEALAKMPEGVGEIRMRSDSAGYQWELMKFCQKGWQGKRISFAISCDVSASFKEAVGSLKADAWQPVCFSTGTDVRETYQQWTEIPFVPEKVLGENPGDCYRFIAVREPIQNELPGTKEPEFPFPTCKIGKGRYKIHGIVTNIPHVEAEPDNGAFRGRSGEFCSAGMWGENIIHWHRERCGKSEQAHLVLKSDLAGGKMPSNLFGANAAWWWISVMTMNLNTIMSKLVLGGEWSNRRMKVTRLRLVNIAARVIVRSRQLYIRVSKLCDKAFELLQKSRLKLMAMMNSPG